MIIPRILLTLLLAASVLFSPGQKSEDPVSVMFYNVENLFDTVDDPLIKDEEFLPKGARRWNQFRFNSKLCSLAKVFVSTGSFEPPGFIGLCEVENRYVLEQLVKEPALSRWNYKIIHKDSPDERGIDVAAIYRPDVFYPLTYRYFPPVPENEPVPRTREILYVMGVLSGADTVHLFVNHWPSRFGGLMETRGARQRAASSLAAEVDKLRQKFCEPLIIITGDFNDQPDDISLTGCLNATLVPGSDPDRLYNLSHLWLKSGKGTLKHQSQWNIFDQLIVSGSLLNNSRKLYSDPSDAVILDLPFLLQPDERYLGMKLFRTYEGFRYTGGYSDHLPVLLWVRKRE